MEKIYKKPSSEDSIQELYEKWTIGNSDSIKAGDLLFGKIEKSAMVVALSKCQDKNIALLAISLTNFRILNKVIVKKEEIGSFKSLYFKTLRKNCIEVLADKSERQRVFPRLDFGGDDTLNFSMLDLNKCTTKSDAGIEKFINDDSIKYFIKKANLDSAQEKLIILKYIMGYSYDEIAEQLQLSKNNVRGGLSRSIKKLRDSFKRHL